MSLFGFSKNEKKNARRILSALTGFIITAICLASCNVGLGESVDTETPTLDITYPSSTAVIRDSFVLFGTWKDDKGVTSVKVSVRNTGTNDYVVSDVPATINTDNTWQIELNDYNSSNSSYYNGWQFADGTYEVSVVASDDAGHASGAATRTFDIDNTPPVFIISNPGVVKTSDSKASSYGTTFTVEGTISDDHTISSMDVIIYDASGNIVSSENYDGETINSFHEDDIATAGGTSVTIAQSGDSRYSAMYTLDEGTEYYTASIKLTDSAKVYKTPTDESSSSRSAAEIKADAQGNSTYTLYLYDDVYTKLMSARKGEGLSAADLKNILNGTYTADSAKKATALALLEEKAKNTEKQNDETNLYFSLNPEANPTYVINGFAWDFDSKGTAQTASNGNTLTVSVNAGLDNYAIDLDGNDDQSSTVKVWLRELDERPTDKDTMLKALSTLSSQVKLLEDNDHNDGVQSFVEYDDATATSPVTNINGYKLIYDYAQSNSGNSSSVTAQTFSVTIPEGSVVLGKYYMVAVTGADIEDVQFKQDTAYGFEGNETGVAPTVVIESPASGALYKSSDEISFTGTATLSSGSLYVSELSVTLAVTDDSNNAVGTKTAAITRSSATGSWSGDTTAIACTTEKNTDGALSWTFTPSLLSGYDDIKAAELSGKSYTYSLELYAKSSSKHDVTMTRYVQVDSTAPVVEISSITPTVSGSEYDDSSNTYVNGTITVKGTVEETNLSGPDDGTDYNGVVMQVYAGGELVRTYSLGKAYSFAQTIDTTELKDSSSLDIRVTAVDKVGNSATYSSLSAEGSSYGSLVILQETDRPVITLGNSSNSSEYVSDTSNIKESTNNLFGTTTNNKLTATITDDDSITRIAVTVYDEDGQPLDDSKVYDGYNANPFTVTPARASYSLSYYLPPEEGVYKVCIDAYDYIETETYTKELGKGTTGTYYIAVSAGAPALALKDVNEYQTAKPEISGTVSSSAKSVTAIVTANDGTATDIGTDYTSGKSGTVAWNAVFDTELNDGSYTILFTAENKWGQQNTASDEFKVDVASPTLAIAQYGSAAVSGDVTEDTDFYVIPSNNYTIKGTVSDGVDGSGVDSVYFCIGDIPSGDISTANGWSLASMTNSGWTAAITSLGDLAKKDGSQSYRFNIVAKDKAGNPSTVNSYIKLYPDAVPPATTLSAGTGLYSADGTSLASAALSSGSTYYVKGSSFSLSGAITENALKSIKINGTSVTVDEDAISWSAAQTVSTEGTSAYTVALEDKAGNTSSSTLYIARDTTAPVVTVSTPAAGANVDGSVTVSGTVNDSGIGVKSVSYAASITTAGSSTPVAFSGTKELDSNGAFAFDTQTLSEEGSCTLTVSAVDKLGNTSTTDSITFYYDKTGPVLSELAVTTPSVGTYTDSSNNTYNVYPSTALAVSAKAADAFTSVSSVTAGSSTLSLSDGTYSGTIIVSPKDDGTASVSFTAQDSFGNPATKVLNGILIDTTAPEITLSSSSATSTDGSISISGTASDNIALASSGSIVVLNGTTQVATATADTNGSWTVNLSSVSDGRYTYKVYALDKAGNKSSEETFSATVDTNKPEVSSSATTADVYLDESGYITLSSTATDTKGSSYNSGIASVYYCINESSIAPDFDSASWTLMTQTSSGYSATVNLTESPYSVSEDKTLYAWFAAKDNAENTSVSSSATVITCDAKAPVITVMNGSTTVTSGNTIKLNDEAVSIKVTVADTNASSLTGTTNNTSSPAVTVTEDTSASVSGASKVYNASFTALNDGSTTAAILTATDENGRTATFNVVVECDTTDPVVAIDSSVATLTNASPVTITGTVKEKNLSSVVVTLAGTTDTTKSYTGTTSTKQSTEEEDTYTFTSTFYGVADGAYTVTATATDEYNNKGTATQSVTSDRTAPAVTVSKPADQASESGNNGYFSFSFTATMSDSLSGIGSVALTDNAFDSLVTYESETAASSASISSSTEYAVVTKTETTGGTTYTYKLYHVASGAHTFNVIATDKAGNQTTGEMSVSADATAPIVTINGASPTVTQGDKVYVNGNIMVTGLVTDETTLTSTDNTLTVKVLDSSSSEVSGAVVTSGTQSKEGWTNNTVLKGTYSSFTFTVDTTKLTDNEEYTIHVEAKDAAGNSATAEPYKITPLQSTDKPVLTLTNASDNSIITGFDDITDGSTNVFGTSSNNYIKGTITDDDGIESIVVSVTPEGGAVAEKELVTGGKATSYTLNTKLSDLGITEEGAYTLVITVKDTLQASSTYSTTTSTLYIAVDDYAPTIAATPTPNTLGYSQYYSSSITVSITASDTSKKVTLEMSGNGASGSYSSAEEVVSTSSATTEATVTDTITISSLTDNASSTTPYSAVYTATDRWGKTNSATVSFYKDSIAPVFKDDDSTVGGTAAMTAVNASTKWFKDETLSVEMKYTEAGSGVDTVYFWLSDSAPSTSDTSTATTYATASNSEGTATVRTSISGFSATSSDKPWYLYVVAYDKAGNVDSTAKYTVKVDATAPDFAGSYYTYDGTNFFAASGTILSNTLKDLTVYGAVSDSASGVAEIGFTMGTSEVSPAVTYTVSDMASVSSGSEFGALSDWASYGSITDKTTITGWKAVFEASAIKEGDVKATPKDTAGNGVAQRLFTISVDTTPPSVSYTALSDADKNTNGTQINGYVQIAGTASDDQQLGAVTELQYQIGTSTGQTAPNASGWAKLSDITGGSYTWTAPVIDTNVSAFDTAETNGYPVFFRALASDSAGNDTAHVISSGALTESAGDYLSAVYIDQNSDRPVIKITGLTLTNGSYILKYGENSAISGTVSDDDSTNTAVVQNFVASCEPITSLDSSYTQTTANGVITTTRAYTPSGSSTSLTETTTFTVATGDWTYTPGDGAVDGEKTVYFYVVDNADVVVSTSSTTAEQGSRTFSTPASTTTDATALLSVPYIYYGTTVADDSSAAVTYRSDSNSPKVDNIQGRYGSSSTIGDEIEYTGLSSSFVAGGSEGRYVQLKVTASDNNGIAGMLLDVTDASKTTLYKRATASSIDGASFSATTTDASSTTEYYVDSASVAPNPAGTTVTWTLGAIDLSSASTGQITVTVTPYDKSGLSGNGAYSFILDNTGPSVTLTSPTSSQTLAGSSIKVTGVTTDTGGSASYSTQWLIPTTTQASGTDSALLALENWSEATYDSSFTFTFSGTNTETTSLAYYASAAYGTADDDGIYTLPLYFKATDELGNAAITKRTVKYNPDADRPVAAITYPDSSILAIDSSTGSTLDYAILGGTIRVTGTVEIPSGDSVYSVYLQISDDNGDFDSDDKTKAGTGGYGYTVIDADTLETNWQTVYGSTGTLNFNNDSSTNSTRRSAWWGIPATLYSSGTSWYITLNSNKELNASSGTNNIKIRVCGVGANGKVSTWSDAYSIHIDSKVPLYSDSPLLYQYSDSVVSTGSTTGETLYNATPTAVRPYSAGMYLKGQWYVYTTVTDETAVKVNSVSTSSGTLTAGTDYFVYPSTADNSSGNASGSSIQTGSESRYTAYIYIKVDQTKTTTQVYTITSEDSDSGNTNTASVSFELNADNVAPAFALNSSGTPVLTDGNGDEISMTKLKNSNHVVTFGSSATDTGSGFERLLFYFKRTVDSETTVELPIPSGSAATNLWANSDSTVYVSNISGLTTDSDLTDSVDSNYNENTLYGISLTGETTVDSSAGTTTFTVSSPSDISAYTFIRQGGLIKLSGVYYTIASVSGTAITVNEAISSTPTSAFAPAALVVDNTSAESTGTWSSGFTVAGDDGDGIIESVKKSGTTWTWDASVFADELEDGPITLVALAFDAAGNVRTLETPVMIANNTPRLAKVYLATDLNGDGTFTDNELGGSTLTDTQAPADYYSALTNGSTGSAQEILTIENSNGSGKTGITMRDKLGLAFEFVGSGYEGYGYGNNDIYYQLKVGTTALKEPTSGTTKTAITTGNSFDSTSGTVTATAAGLKGFEISIDDISSGSYGTYSEYEASGTQKVNYIGVTLWDSTKGTTPGTGDTYTEDSDGNKTYTAFGSQYTVVNIPLYIDLTDDQYPVPSIASVEPAKITSGSTTTTIGHIELSSTLPSTNFPDTYGEFDTDTKISGTVVFTGTVTDEKRIESITLTSSSAINSTLTEAVTVAKYESGLLSATEAASATTGWTFAINETDASDQFTLADGHKVTWTLTLDSSYVAGIAASDVKFTLTANDAAPNSASASYQVDIVPYITGITRASDGGIATGHEDYGNINRSKLGHYPVSIGETLTINGFNLSSTTVTLGSTALDASTYSVTTTDGATSFVVPAFSGKLKVTVNSMDSLNNLNGDPTISGNVLTSGDYDNNVETYKVRGSSTTYYANDDRYLEVWNLGNYFKSTDGGVELQNPVMTANASGRLFASWVAQSNSNVMFSYGVANSVTPIFRCYDQPSTYTGIGFDTKSDTSTGASIAFIPEHQGYGGTFSMSGLSSSQIDGGMGAIQVTASDINASTPTVYGSSNAQKVQVTGNPNYRMDGNNYTAYFNIANYDMNHRLGSYEKPKSAKYDKYMHSIWHDNVTDSLKYSVVNTSETRYGSMNAAESSAGYGPAGGVVGWVVLDGGYTGQDRLHTWTRDKTGKTNNMLTAGEQNAVWVGNTGSGTNSVTADYSTDLFLAPTGVQRYESGVSSIVKKASTTSITVTGATSSFNPSVGDTIVLMDLTAGSYQSSLRRLTGVPNNSPNGTYSWKGAVSHSIHAATVYAGDLNVVGVTSLADTNTTATVSGSSGSSADIDVDTNGQPVVAYFDDANSTLKIAKADSKEPKYASNWTRIPTGCNCSGSVSMRIDGADNIHIMYKNEDGQLCYLFGEVNEAGTGYNFNAPELIDETGSLDYGEISIIETTAKSTGTPCMTYMNSAGTAQAVKYAYRTSVPSYSSGSTASTSLSDNWDYMILPSLGSGHYAVAENQISLEARKSGWTGTDISVLSNGGDYTATPAKVQAAIAFKSKMFETAYLMTE